MQKILFVDQDHEMRDWVKEFNAQDAASRFTVHTVNSLKEAERELETNGFDGIILDVLTPAEDDLFIFIRRQRERNTRLSIIVLIGFVDMVLDQKLKDALKGEHVSIMNKLEALQSPNLFRLFEAAASRGFGNEI